MHTYVATFFSHYEAVMFYRNMGEKNIAAKKMPVPRRVSSSCGTGVLFETDLDIQTLVQEGVDKIFFYENGNYSLAYEVE